MALAVDIIDRHGPSNKMHRHLQPKKTKVTLYYQGIYVTAKDTSPALHYLLDRVCHMGGK